MTKQQLRVGAEKARDAFSQKQCMSESSPCETWKSEASFMTEAPFKAAFGWILVLKDRPLKI